MEQRQSPSFPRITVIIAGLILRRFFNRLTSGLRRRGAGRLGTGRKAVGNPLGMIAIIAVFVFNSLTTSRDALRTLSAELGPPRDTQGRVLIAPATYGALKAFDDSEQPGQRAGDQSAPRHHDKEEESALLILFQYESNDAAANPSTRQDYARQLADEYQQSGLDGFSVLRQRHGEWLPRLAAWSDPRQQPVLLTGLGLVLLILAGARHFWTMGSRNQDLGKVEWSTEWLFTLPASSRALFGAQILGHAAVDPFSWIGTIPFLLVVYRSSGAHWAIAIPLALGNALYLGFVMAALRVLSETWLRKRLNPARLKNLQALFTLIGIVLLFLLFALARSREVIQWVARLAVARSPFLAWNPFSTPVLALRDPLRVALVEGCSAAGFILLAVRGCSLLVRDGLIASPAVYQGRKLGGGRDLLPAGIIGKDMRLLLRDRNFFVQTLVAPALIVCFQIVFNVGMAEKIGSNYHLAATFAFAVGAYVMISTGLNVLSVEGNSLWMLYGLPVSLASIMLRKTLLWSLLGLAYAAIVLAACAWHIRVFHGIDLSYTTVALAGVIIYSFIASGIGMLATDPLEVEVRRRIRPGMIYLYMILATLYGYALYAPGTWARLGQIVLSSLLAYALWQKVRDRTPFLLDAVSMPPPRVSLADGLMAALGFFVLQGLLGIWFLGMHMAFGKAIVLAFASAGALVVLFTLIMFWRARVVGVLSAVGLTPPAGARRAWAVILGILLGCLGGALACGYLILLHHYPELERSHGPAMGLSRVRGWWLPLLGVIAAPLFEEFIFRGLVFRGMRRSLPARWSVAASAAVFAICHPPLSVVPVFCMGVLAAVGFEFTGWIVTPVCVHMTYNGLVLLAGYLLQRNPHL